MLLSEIDLKDQRTSNYTLAVPNNEQAFYEGIFFSYQTSVFYVFAPNGSLVQAVNGTQTIYANWSSTYFSLGDVAYGITVVGFDEFGSLIAYAPYALFSD